MFIPVHRKIADPGQFRASAQKSLPEVPVTSVKRIIKVFPSATSNEATCIREADSI